MANFKKIPLMIAITALSGSVLFPDRYTNSEKNKNRKIESMNKYQAHKELQELFNNVNTLKIIESSYKKKGHKTLDDKFVGQVHPTQEMLELARSINNSLETIPDKYFDNLSKKNKILLSEAKEYVNAYCNNSIEDYVAGTHGTNQLDSNVIDYKIINITER